jgi:hypothetical protein
MYATVVNLAECLSIHICVTKSMDPLNLGLRPAGNDRLTRTIVIVAMDH